MSAKTRWYELGQIKWWSETYDVYKLFGAYFIRLHYKQISFFTGETIPRQLIEVHPQSEIGWLIQRTVDGQPANVFEVLDMIHLAGITS